MLSCCETEAVNGALGVGVSVGGLGVFVGGTNENGVFVGMEVKVGRGVFVGVISSVGLEVHVACIWISVGVVVGPCCPLITTLPGRRKFMDESGLKKMSAKYPTRQAVMIKTRIESISHIFMAVPPPPRDRVGFPSKLKSSLIEFAPYYETTAAQALHLPGLFALRPISSTPFPAEIKVRQVKADGSGHVPKF